MSDLEMWTLVVGFFLPLVLSVIIQTGWDPRLQSIVAFVVAALIAAGTLALKGDLTGRSWVSASLIILVTAIATYHGFWKPTNVAPSIESRTNFGSSTPSAE